VRDVLEPLADRSNRLQRTPNEDGTHKANIASILKSLDIAEQDRIGQAWLRLATKGSAYSPAARAHRDALARPRPVDREFKDFLEEMETILDTVLGKFESNYLAFHHLLDKLLSERSPTREHAKTLKNHAPNNVASLSYFFDKLSDPAWLGPLKDEGFFKNPPEPERDSQAGTVRVLVWPQSRFLARIAGLRPTDVLEILLGIGETENILVRQDMVNAALAMPVELAERLAPICTAQADSPFQFSVSEKLIELAIRFAQNGKVDSAISIARVLLKVDSSEEKSWTYGDTWQYEQLLKKITPGLTSAGGELALGFFCDLLEQAIQVSQYSSKEPYDLSYVWRPAIEDHAQNEPEDRRSLLVTAVRDTATCLLANDRISLAELVRILDSRRWQVFKRISFYILFRFPEAAPELVVGHLADRNLFDEIGFHHEYGLLARSQFQHLREDYKSIILNWIEKGPDLKEFELTEEAGRKPSEQEIAQYVKSWRLDHLALLGDGLPEDWKKRYEVLVAELGEPKHPEFAVWGGVVHFTGPTSPKEAEVLRQMSVEEVLQFLTNWRPSEGTTSASPEGLARELAKVVASEPRQFAEHAERFRGLDQAYTQGLLTGLRDAVEQKRSLPWSHVLSLCQWVVSQPAEIGDRVNTGSDHDLDWTWARRLVVQLLSAGLRRDLAEIPQSLRSQVWEVLKALTDDPDPSPASELRFDIPSTDFHTASINTTRGLAIHGVVLYALWVRRLVGSETEGKLPVVQGFDQVPEAREILDLHLDLSREATRTVHSVYGICFPSLTHLDRDWAKENVIKIFPRQETLLPFRDAAWEAYVKYCEPYDLVLDLLMEEYTYEVNNLGRGPGLSDEHLVEHLMAYYWRGKLAMKDPQDLISMFFANAPDHLCGHALEFVGRCLRNTNGAVPREMLERLRTLWLSRLSTIRDSKTPALHVAELDAFGWWFASGKFEDQWAVEQLKEALTLSPHSRIAWLVIDRLKELVQAMSVPALECLDLIIERDMGGLAIIASRDDIRSLLATALGIPNKRIQEIAIVIINHLCARGHLDFRDLLPENSGATAADH
jgi:hypothetical protein